jgi:hypothetical protein
MTVFGKIILGILMLIVAGGVYYGVTLSVKNDVTATPVTFGTTTIPVPEDVSATSTATSTASTSPTTTAATSTKPTTKKIAFSEFIKQGGSYKCMVTQTVATMTTMGTVYLDNGKVKAEFEVSVAGQTISTSMIIRDGYSYTWTSNSPTKGFKTKIATGGQGNSSAGAKGTITWDGSQIGDYSCDPWVADASVFEIPKTVTFTVQ